MPLQNDVKGSIAATLTKVACAGVAAVEEDAMTGTATITEPATAIFFMADYDVNADGKVDILDITEAQRHYQADAQDENWAEVQKMDVNGDGQVDIEDYIAIFHQIADF